MENNKDSPIDDLRKKDVESINKGILLALITDTRILIVDIINKGINIMEILNQRLLSVLQTGSSSSQDPVWRFCLYVYLLQR